jgi:hypothetical protein
MSMQEKSWNFFFKGELGDRFIFKFLKEEESWVAAWLSCSFKKKKIEQWTNFPKENES